MTTICPKIPLSAASPIEFDVFFDKRTEIPIIHNHEDRQLPPPTRPATSCDLNLFFGFFFDGTRNNYNLCAENEAYSNVARLHDCCWRITPDSPWFTPA